MEHVAEPAELIPLAYQSQIKADKPLPLLQIIATLCIVYGLSEAVGCGRYLSDIWQSDWRRSLLREGFPKYLIAFEMLQTIAGSIFGSLLLVGGALLPALPKWVVKRLANILVLEMVRLVGTYLVAITYIFVSAAKPSRGIAILRIVGSEAIWQTTLMVALIGWLWIARSGVNVSVWKSVRLGGALCIAFGMNSAIRSVDWVGGVLGNGSFFTKTDGTVGVAYLIAGIALMIGGIGLFCKSEKFRWITIFGCGLMLLSRLGYGARGIANGLRYLKLNDAGIWIIESSVMLQVVLSLMLAYLLTRPSIRRTFRTASLDSLG